jgi:hypothetical protein
MSGTAHLERNYRRLLGVFPAGHRAVHEEEMLDVLMAGARAGQRRPGLAESADLAWGALRIRLRLTPESSWADALAVVSVVLPLVALVVYAGIGWNSLEQVPPRLFWTLAAVEGRTVGAPLLLLMLVLLRLRRTAALATVAVLVWDVWAVVSGGLQNWIVISPATDVAIFALVLEAVALAVSPGPRRGLQLLTRGQIAFTIAAAAAVGLSGVVTQSDALRQAILVTVIVATMAGLAVVSALSRRVMLLVSVPVYYFAIGSAVPPLVGSFGQVSAWWEGPMRVTLICLPLAVLGCMTLAAALRAHRRGAAAGGQHPAS